MNLIWIPWGIFLILLQLLPFGQRPPEKPEIKTPAKGWWMVSYFGVPPTRYSRDRAGIIKAESLGTRSSLFKEVKEKEINFPVLSWRWKISNVVRSAIAMVGGGTVRLQYVYRLRRYRFLP